MGLEEFGSSGSRSYNSGSGRRTSDEAKYKDKEWLSEQLEDCIRDHLVLKVEIANIFLEKVYPMYQNDEHRSKEGFMQMAKYADQMAELRDNSGKRKYTHEYFENTEMENW